MTEVGNGIDAEIGRWSFGGDTCENFDEHVRKSIPLYDSGHSLICQLSETFLHDNAVCYDLGCSTGELLVRIAEKNKDKRNIRFIGIDDQENMIKKAKEKAKAYSNIDFYPDDILQFEYESADMVVAYYTIQFIKPAQRQRIFDIIYKALKWGGAFLLFEKVRGPDARFQDIMSLLYVDYKLEQGYSESDIIHKSRSLKGILEPFSTQGNIDFLKRAGFVDIMTIQKYISFEGFFAIK